jgi:hypothetical protein
MTEDAFLAGIVVSSVPWPIERNSRVSKHS